MNTADDLRARLRILANDYPVGSIHHNTVEQAIAALSAAVPVEALEELVKLKEAYCRCDGTQEAEDAAILAILNKIDELTQLIKERSNG